MPGDLPGRGPRRGRGVPGESSLEPGSLCRHEAPPCCLHRASPKRHLVNSQKPGQTSMSERREALSTGRRCSDGPAWVARNSLIPGWWNGCQPDNEAGPCLSAVESSSWACLTGCFHPMEAVKFGREPPQALCWRGCPAGIRSCAEGSGHLWRSLQWPQPLQHLGGGFPCRPPAVDRPGARQHCRQQSRLKQPTCGRTQFSVPSQVGSERRAPEPANLPWQNTRDEPHRSSGCRLHLNRRCTNCTWYCDLFISVDGAILIALTAFEPQKIHIHSQLHSTWPQTSSSSVGQRKLQHARCLPWRGRPSSRICGGLTKSHPAGNIL
ncbi:hypothetical protein B0T24DRAFT_6067 [Lasiosphaeria ovina]|uniref:Uncharacterized protein n=1 Tax=Lasiosphaeria ovina TaxID=92902 RepID=A0AAE0NJ01_9PEZI|nr:hypothetical protein B0T24DRAFT_6067 [Lasiosphaeria ovina]